MLSMRHSPQRFSKPTGFSLVELMISIVIGLVVVGGVISVFASAVKSHTDNLRMTRLNQELRTTMTLMTRELRRAGFWGGAKTGVVLSAPAEGILNTLPTATALGQINPFAVVLPTIETNCITYNYDDIPYGAGPVAAEQRGFRLNAGGAVDSGTGTGVGCGGTWAAITDSNAINITALTFTPSSVALDIDGVTDGGGAVPCTPTAPAGACVAGFFTPAPTVPVSEITITLTGHLVGDTATVRTLKETVRVYQ